MNLFILIFIFIFGLIIGSFLNVVILRLHAKKKITGRSTCPKCGKKISWYENIPLLSFAFLAGKCFQCKKKISWQYPLVELSGGLLFALSWYINYKIFELSQFANLNYFILSIVRDFFLISVMIIVFVYDLRWYLILDIITLPAAAIILTFNLTLEYLSQNLHLLQTAWQNYLVSGIIGGSFFLFQFIISRGKWIGGGDIRMGFLMGLALGWPLVLVALSLSYFIGSIVAVGLVILGKKRWGSQIPFGVFLSISTIITLFWGTEILNWYLSIF